MAARPPRTAPPVAPRRESPLASRTAPVQEILGAAAIGLGGLVVGLLPLTLMVVAVNMVETDLPEAFALPLNIAGVLFAGMCAGYVAAWRLRPHGIRGRRLAGQLSILFMEAVVIVVILANPGADREPDGCQAFCFSGDSTLRVVAIMGWPVSAVGALLGSHLFVRRLWDRGIGLPAPDPVQEPE